MNTVRGFLSRLSGSVLPVLAVVAISVIFVPMLFQPPPCTICGGPSDTSVPITNNEERCKFCWSLVSKQQPVVDKELPIE